MQCELKDQTEVFKTFKHQSNSLVLSSLKNFYKPVVSKGFALKYVIHGLERYVLNDKGFNVTSGKYLLSNCEALGSVEIESKRNVDGICINILPEILAEVVASLNRPDTAFSDVELGNYFSSSMFLENMYDANHTNVGRLLFALQHRIRKDEFSDGHFDLDFFYGVSEAIVSDQIPVFKKLQEIPSIKPVTKKELYRSVTKGKEFIDATFLSNLSISMISKEAGMSDYHFFRLFKTVFKQSPKQYIIQKRLKFAYDLLLKERITISQLAIETGFSDIHAFSKAFKNQYGVSPSTFFDTKLAGFDKK
jgi:AraC family transcriptional regulator